MKNIESLKNRVNKAEEAVEKQKNTIERHKKQAEKKLQRILANNWDPNNAFCQEGTAEHNEAYWLICEYEQKLEDIRNAEKKLNDRVRILNDLKQRLALEEEKLRFLDETTPSVVKDFMEQWKKDSIKYYKGRYKVFLKFKEDLKEQVRQARIQGIKTLPEYQNLIETRKKYSGEVETWSDYDLLNVHPRKPLENYLEELKLDHKSIQKELNAQSDYVIAKMIEERENREIWLTDFMEQEKTDMMLDLMERVFKITGPITDATYLSVGPKGIEGYIIGENGKAKVDCISAGGYNIQCLHLRMLVHEIKEK